MIDDLTPHLALALPHPDNDLADDVLRLRAALLGLDSKLAILDALLESDDIDLDEFRELARAIRANRTDIAGLLASKADAAATQARFVAAEMQLGTLATRTIRLQREVRNRHVFGLVTP